MPLGSLCTLVLLATSASEPWSQLSLGTCDVLEFAREHPAGDGRGVVIAVLDTGVEPNVPGLRDNPDGFRKVIDVQDFSGEGDVFYFQVETRGAEAILAGKEGEPIAFKLPDAKLLSTGGQWHAAWLDEEQFADSDSGDLDGDGQLETRTGVLVFPSTVGEEPRYVAIVDANRNRDFGDDPVLADYRVRFDTVELERKAPEADRRTQTLAVNIFPAERRLSFHFDNGGHGTHVAGIAAGWRIGGQAGHDGVAPHAQVISLKIGNNGFSGGATTPGSKMAAFRYAARFARERNVRIVANLSYGIGSEREGDSDIEKDLEELLRNEPLLVVCAAAGNEGPGLSTIGTPAAAPSLISSAALLPRETARDVHGVDMPSHALAGFSSRGAESTKPDIATPGYASSTVPFWSGDDFSQGTSMASPYTAGLCARLLSAAAAANLPPPTRSTVARALRSGAQPVPGYTPLDYGAGVPQLRAAFAALESLAKAQQPNDPAALIVTTESPMGDGEVHGSAVWRGYLPDRPQSFRIAAAMPADPRAADREQFVRRYRVVSRVPWAKPVEETVYLRDGQSADVRVAYDAAAFAAPGAYLGDVELRAEGLPDGVAADAILRSVVIVPERVDGTKEWKLALAPAMAPTRLFLQLPPWASAAEFALRAPAPRTFRANAGDLFAPDGRSVSTRMRLDDDDAATEAKWTWTDIEPGVVELPIYDRRGQTGGEVALSLRLSSLRSTPPEVASLAGRRADLAVQNLGPAPIRARGKAVVEGDWKEYEAEFGGEDRIESWKEEIKLSAEHIGVRVRVEFAREDFLRMTDVAILLKGEGAILQSDGMGTREAEITHRFPSAGEREVELSILPGFARRFPSDEFSAKVTVVRLFADEATADVLNPSGGKDLLLPPGAPAPLHANLPKRKGALSGYVRFQEIGSDAEVLRVPLKIRRDTE